MAEDKKAEHDIAEGMSKSGEKAGGHSDKNAAPGGGGSHDLAAGMSKAGQHPKKDFDRKDTPDQKQ
jgi:hypothetical protein